MIGACGGSAGSGESGDAKCLRGRWCGTHGEYIRIALPELSLGWLAEEDTGRWFVWPGEAISTDWRVGDAREASLVSRHGASGCER
jgi:hypothetical protein